MITVYTHTHTHVHFSRRFSFVILQNRFKVGIENALITGPFSFVVFVRFVSDSAKFPYVTNDRNGIIGRDRKILFEKGPVNITGRRIFERPTRFADARWSLLIYSSIV